MNDGYLLTDVALACTTDKLCVWRPNDERGTALNADHRVISRRRATAEEAEQAVLDILAKRA